MSALAIDLRRTAGYIVADRQGRLVGKVECPMYGPAPDVPDALSVKSGLFSRRRRLVPADTIQHIDGASGGIGLRGDRPTIRSFLYAGRFQNDSCPGPRRAVKCALERPRGAKGTPGRPSVGL